MKILRQELIDFVYWLNANIQNTIQDHLDEEEVDKYLESIDPSESNEIKQETILYNPDEEITLPSKGLKMETL